MYQYFAYIALVLLSAISIAAMVKARTAGVSGTGNATKKFSIFFKAEAFIEIHAFWLLILLFAVFLFSRLVRLDVVPAGIHMDELSMAYDAKCLAEFGTDRHGIHFPVYLEAYGDGQSALYAYLAAICIKVFGYSVKAIRFPAVLCGCVAFFAAYFLLKEMYGERKWGLLGAIMIMITPFFMTSERWGLDCNLFLSLSVAAFFFYYKAIKSSEWKYYIIAGIVFGITLYTYILSYLVLPLFLIFSTLYLIYIRKFELKKTLGLVIPLVLLALPLLFMQLINMGFCPEFTFLLSDYRRLGWYRVSEFSISNIKGIGACIKLLLFGNTWITYNSLKEYGAIYLFSLPLLLYGFVLCIKDTYLAIRNKEWNAEVLILLFSLIAFFVFVLTGDDNMHKVNEIFFSFILFIIIAVKRIFDIIPEVVPVIAVCFAVGFFSFALFYFKDQNDVYGMHPLFLSTELGDVVAYEEEVYNPTHAKVYVEMAYEHQNAKDLMIGLYGNVEPRDWSDTSDTLGHIQQHLPENINPEEKAVYIIGHNWDHIVNYMVSEWGFQADNSFPSYTILYR